MYQVLLWVGALCAVSCGAAKSEGDPHVWVIAVGVGKYVRAINTLPGAAGAAQKIADALVAARPDCTEAVILTTDSDDESSQPTVPNVMRAVDQVRRSVHPDDLVIFYFCGHGIEEAAQQYLLLKDTDLSSDDLLKMSTISLSGLRKRLEDLPCSGRIMLLDACRESRRSLETTGSVESPAPMSRDFLISGGGWHQQAGRVSATLFGCDEGGRVYHGGKGPLFTEALIDGLEGRARDEQGQVTFQSLLEHVRKTVPNQARREFGATAKQDPVAKGFARGVVLVPAPGFVACPPFAGEFGQLFAETLQTRLAASGELLLVERIRLTEALNELKLQDTALVDGAYATNLGKLLNAKYVLVGSSTRGPDGYLHVSARLVVTQTGMDVGGIAAQCVADSEDWRPAVTALADDLLRQMKGLPYAKNRESGGSDAGTLKTSGKKIPASAVEWPIADGGNGHFYQVKVVQEGMGWDLARRVAMSYGGYLATLTTWDENHFVLQLAAKVKDAWVTDGNTSIRGPWIGAYRTDKDTHWRWITGEVMTEPYWGGGWLPDGGAAEPFAQLFGHHGQIATGWNDISWPQPGFVVEYDPTGKTFDTTARQHTGGLVQ